MERVVTSPLRIDTAAGAFVASPICEEAAGAMDRAAPRLFSVCGVTEAGGPLP